MKDFVEQQILRAVRKILSGRVNEIIGDWEENLPAIEFGNYQSDKVITPIITLDNCEKTEKERIIRLDTYSLNITFSFKDTENSEMYCYSFAAAVTHALCEDVTLGGIADRAVITGKKYLPPKEQGC